MKAARKARQNTLGTARRKAHTPRHTQRHITAESTRRRLATACIRLDISAARAPSTNASPRKRTRRRHSSIRCPCYTRAQRQHIAENARRDTPSAAAPRKAYTPCPSKKAAPPTYTSLHATRHLCYARPAPTHRRESARRDIRQFDALATRAPHFQRPRASRRTRFRSARHPFSSCADVTFIL